MKANRLSANHPSGVVFKALSSAVLLACSLGVQAAAVSGQGTWQTTLQGRDLDGNAANGFEAFYDTVLNLTWLANANLLKAQGVVASGETNWSVAQSAVSALNVNGVTGWRLPQLLPANGGSYNYNFSFNGSTDVGYNQASPQSELAHLFHVTLGNKSGFTVGGSPQSGGGAVNTGPFVSLDSSRYWTGTDYGQVSGDAWAFYSFNGYQGNVSKAINGLTWAVRTGDIAPVPEPSTVVLMGLGLLCVATLSVKRR